MIKFRGEVIAINISGLYMWLASVSDLDACAGGVTKTDAVISLASFLNDMSSEPRCAFNVVFPDSEQSRMFEIGTDNTRAALTLLLKRRRIAAGMTLSQADEKLGTKSHDAYARYENGELVPTIEMLDRLLNAVDPECDLVIGLSESGERPKDES